MTDLEKKDANAKDRLQQIARMINEELPENWGFVLMAFPYDDENGRINYVSSCRREDGIMITKKWLDQQTDPKSFGKHL